MLLGEEPAAGLQGPPRGVERVAGAAAVPAGVLLDPAAALVERVGSEADDVERVHHGDCLGQLLAGGGLEAGEAVHRDDLDPGPPGLVAGGEPVREHGFGAALDHVQQPGGSAPVADGGEVDDHGDVLVTAARVSPDVLIDTEDADPVEAVGVIDQDPLPLRQNGVVGGVPGHREGVSDPGDSEPLRHERFQRPPQRGLRQLRPRRRGRVGVLPPDVTALDAPIPAEPDQQRRRTPPERLMREPADHGVPGRPSHPQRRHHPSSATTRHASTVRSGSIRCPTTRNPRPSRRVNVVKSGAAKVASITSGSSGWGV